MLYVYHPLAGLSTFMALHAIRDTPLKVEPRDKLDQPAARVVRRREVAVGRAQPTEAVIAKPSDAGGVVGRITDHEVGAVKRIEKFCAELEVHVFAYPRLFHDAQVEAGKPRTID